MANFHEKMALKKYSLFCLYCLCFSNCFWITPSVQQQAQDIEQFQVQKEQVEQYVQEKNYEQAFVLAKKMADVAEQLPKKQQATADSLLLMTNQLRYPSQRLHHYLTKVETAIAHKDYPKLSLLIKEWEISKEKWLLQKVNSEERAKAKAVFSNAKLCFNKEYLRRGELYKNRDSLLVDIVKKVLEKRPDAGYGNSVTQVLENVTDLVGKDQKLFSHHFDNIFKAQVALIDRSSESILALYDTYHLALFYLISPTTYERSQLNLCNDMLRAVYDDIQNNGHIEQFKQIKKRYSKEKMNGYELHEALNPMLNSDLTLALDHYAYFEHWVYAFWYRRYVEQNMEATYEILNNIDKHYQ